MRDLPTELDLLFEELREACDSFVRSTAAPNKNARVALRLTPA